MPRKETAIIYVTYDGALNCASGVGVLSRSFITSMPRVVENSENLAFHVVAVNLTEAADGYNPSIQQDTRAIVHSLGGDLHLIDNGLDGAKGYGGPNNWRQACQGAAKTIAQIAEQYKRSIVYLVDTPFMCLPFYYPKILSERTTFIIVPHSDTYSHFPNAIEVERLGWEAAAMQSLQDFKNVYLAKTSEFLLYTLCRNTILFRTPR